ncbi:MAG TPA: EAL domain-containing protein [Burkholderiales bacterium]|nr:EAL domain-containing protein [Burkholderiales bacterium]
MQDKTVCAQRKEDIFYFQNIVDNMPDMVVMFEPETLRLVYLNSAATDCLGYSREELLQMSICQLCPVLPEFEFRHRISSMQTRGRSMERFEIVKRRKDGTDFPADVSMYLVKKTDGNDIYVVIARSHAELKHFPEILPAEMIKLQPASRHVPAESGMHDVIVRMQAEEAEQLVALMSLHSSESMLITDSQGIIVSVNRAFTAVTGYTAPEVVGKNSSILRSGRHNKSFYRAMWKEINTSGHWQGEIWNRRKNGELYLEWITINTLYNKDRSVRRYVGLFSDITKKKTSEELVWQQANFDMLTGLPNRHMFQSRLELEIKKARQDKSSIALLFVDIDNFKEVNDSLGHNIGDLLLVEAARRIQGCVMEPEAVARISSDEFVVILPALENVGNVERIVQNIMERMAEAFQLGEEKSFVSASVGVSFYPEDATNAEALLKNAGQAMHAAKAQGRNSYCYFTSSMQNTAKMKRKMVNELREALDKAQFRVFYQPIVTLNNGALHKAEALIRWQHPVRGLISPAEFIPVAEEIGLITAIGDWVFREAASQAARWRELYYAKFQISINVSPVQFRHYGANFEAWFQYLNELKLSGQSIVVEITEGLLLDVHASVTSQLLSFRDAGIRVSLDDFGTGYSALSYLKKFDIDYLKIDQSFVRDLEHDANDMALCEAIIVMAHKLGLKVIAEGIETEEQRRLLTAVGCDYGQGYLFSAPLAARDFELRLKATVS